MEISNNNLYSFNIDYFSRAKAQKETKSNEQKVEPDTNAVEKNESSTKSKYEENQEKKHTLLPFHQLHNYIAKVHKYVPFFTLYKIWCIICKKYQITTFCSSC